MKRGGVPLVVMLVAALATLPVRAQPVDDASAWRSLAEKVDAGATVDIRLRDGKHFKATFIAARADGIVVQRKTRIPVPVEAIAYDRIAALARPQPAPLSAGKVAAIALGSAGAAIGTLFLILLATID